MEGMQPVYGVKCVWILRKFINSCSFSHNLAIMPGIEIAKLNLFLLRSFLRLEFCWSRPIEQFQLVAVDLSELELREKWNTICSFWHIRPIRSRSQITKPNLKLITRRKKALGERRSRESPCFLIVFKWTKTRNKWLAKLSREQKGGILNTTIISIATVLYSQRVFVDISSSYLQPEISWLVKISNQDVRIFCDGRNNYAWAIKQLSQHF